LSNHCEALLIIVKVKTFSGTIGRGIGI